MSSDSDRRFISIDPVERLGFYKCLHDVPDRHRLYNHAGRYKGEDTWKDWSEEKLYPVANSKSTRKYSSLTGRRWRIYIEDHGEAVHHALATPTDVDGFCRWLIEEIKMTNRTAYDNYLRFLERFYDDLLWHTDHPHVYNPVLMAAANVNANMDHEYAEIVWQMKFDRPDGRS